MTNDEEPVPFVARIANHHSMEIAAVLLALLGHAFLWIGLVNRLHAVGVRRPIINAFTVGFFLCAAPIPIGIGGWWYAEGIERP